jgi:hypothetical protein
MSSLNLAAVAEWFLVVCPQDFDRAELFCLLALSMSDAGVIRHKEVVSTVFGNDFLEIARV